MVRGVRLLVVKLLARNDFLFSPHEDRQFLCRAEAAQCLQGCGRLRGRWLAAGPGHDTGFPNL